MSPGTRRLQVSEGSRPGRGAGAQRTSPFPPVRLRRRLDGGGTSWLQAPPRRATLAKGLLHSGPQFPRLSGAVEGGPEKSPGSGAAQERRTPGYSVGAQPCSPTPHSGPDPGRDGAAPVPRVGSAGGVRSPARLGKMASWAQEDGAWTLPGVDQRNMGACGAAERRVLSRAPFPSLPAGGAAGAGLRLCAPRQVALERRPELSDGGDHRPSPTWGNGGPS